LPRIYVIYFKTITNDVNSCVSSFLLVLIFNRVSGDPHDDALQCQQDSTRMRRAYYTRALSTQHNNIGTCTFVVENLISLFHFTRHATEYYCIKWSSATASSTSLFRVLFYVLTTYSRQVIVPLPLYRLVRVVKCSMKIVNVPNR
jgi:hypothetical protein